MDHSASVDRRSKTGDAPLPERKPSVKERATNAGAFVFAVLIGVCAGSALVVVEDVADVIKKRPLQRTLPKG
jgi:hypothetical protein